MKIIYAHCEDQISLMIAFSLSLVPRQFLSVPLTPRVNFIMETYSVVLTFESDGVTIQLKPLQQYFCMVPFVCQYFIK